MSSWMLLCAGCFTPSHLSRLDKAVNIEEAFIAPGQVDPQVTLTYKSRRGELYRASIPLDVVRVGEIESVEAAENANLIRATLNSAVARLTAADLDRVRQATVDWRIVRVENPDENSGKSSWFEHDNATSRPGDDADDEFSGAWLFKTVLTSDWDDVRVADTRILRSSETASASPVYRVYRKSNDDADSGEWMFVNALTETERATLTRDTAIVGYADFVERDLVVALDGTDILLLPATAPRSNAPGFFGSAFVILTTPVAVVFDVATIGGFTLWGVAAAVAILPPAIVGGIGVLLFGVENNMNWSVITDGDITVEREWLVPSISPRP